MGIQAISVDAEEINLSPYTWKHGVEGKSACIEAAMPGAYIKLEFTNSSSIGMRVTNVSSADFGDSAMPVIEFSLDDGPFTALQLPKCGDERLVVLAQGLAPRKSHKAEILLRASALKGRWTSPAGRLTVTGFAFDDGVSLLPWRRQRKVALGFGDSITEGVYAEGGTHGYYGNLMENNARLSWFPLVCSALGCEYGQLGSGGLGVLKPGALPPLSKTWSHYDETSSRLVKGVLAPAPDYVFCCMGTNDFEGNGAARTHLDISTAYFDFLGKLRGACQEAEVFCIVPPLGWHAEEIAAAVAKRLAAGDRNVHLLDTSPLRHGYNERNEPSLFACDGCHPDAYGNALLATLIAVEAQKVVCNKEKSKGEK